jgi:predicted glycosyltransferase
MYAQNGAGLGHFRRCATVAEALVSSAPDTRVVIAGRSLHPAATIGIPSGCDLLKLPAFAPLGEDAHGERRVLSDREDERFARLRMALLTTLLRELRPATLLVDNEPRGVGGELLDALDAARAEGLVGRVLCGLRDIRGHPEHVVSKWARDGTAEVLATRYDGVLVYGDQSVFDTAGAYGLGTDIPVPTRSVGYVFSGRPASSRSQVRAKLFVNDGAPLVAVTAGSGADGFALLTRYADEVVPALPEAAVSVLVTGPSMPSDEREKLAWRSGGAVRVVPTFDVVSLVHAADAVVSRGGYNSLCEAVHAGQAPVVVPRRTASREQETRATAFADAGWAHALDPQPEPGALRAAVLQALEAGPRGTSPFDPDASAKRAVDCLLEPWD